MCSLKYQADESLRALGPGYMESLTLQFTLTLLFSRTIINYQQYVETLHKLQACIHRFHPGVSSEDIRL
jgi:precorrin-3B methylase